MACDWLHGYTVRVSVADLAGPRDSAVRPAQGPSVCFCGLRDSLLKVSWHDGQGAYLFRKRMERAGFCGRSPAVCMLTISAVQLGHFAVRHRFEKSSTTLIQNPVLQMCLLPPCGRLARHQELLPNNQNTPSSGLSRCLRVCPGSCCFLTELSQHEAD
jgi:hypothetical protein